MKLTIKTPAKINLFLEITGRRPDGYHNLESIMQTVSLYDELDFELSDSISISLAPCGRGQGEGLPLDDNNIVIKAAKSLKENFNIQKGVKITLKKNIPLGAGLGGGSSDAAAAIKALVKLWDIKAEKEKLNKIAAKLGADVPFFLTGGAALCEGIGEIVTPLRNSALSLVLANPGFGVPTPSVYKKVKLPFTNTQKIDKIKNLINEGSFNVDNAKEACFNRLEDFVLNDYPEIKKIKDVLASSDCASFMSGSGATVFGIYQSEDREKIETELKKYSWSYWFVETLPSF